MPVDAIPVLVFVAGVVFFLGREAWHELRLQWHEYKSAQWLEEHERIEEQLHPRGNVRRLR